MEHHCKSGNQKKRSFMYSAIKKILLPVTLLSSPSVLADQCNALDSWFPHDQTPRPDDSAFQSSSNCVFHQWSWQMFLWLTQNVDGKPRFLSFQTPQSLLGMPSRGLLPRMGKSPVPESLDEYLQAGTDGILVDHAGQPVYYSQYLNPTFANFIQKNNLTDAATVRKMDPNTTFPIDGKAGSLELKVSWKIVGEGEDTSDKFTMDTDVALLENKNGVITINPEKTRKVKVALVGFHIGGIVNGHPEMIWATFEHKNNAPNVPSDATLETPVSNEDFTFYTAKTILGECNINPAVSGLTLDEKSQSLSPITQVCRQYEFGNADSKKPSITSNTQSITTINSSVNGKFANDDVWKNYQEVGAIWFLQTDALAPGMSITTDTFTSPATGKDVSLTGSLKLSNSTLETFTQRQTAMDNCFRCHNTAQEFPPKMGLSPLPATNLNISHAFQNIYFWSQELQQKK